MSDREQRRRLNIVGPEVSEPGSSPVAAEHNGTDDGFLLVGDLAKATGKTVRALHLYEELGRFRTAENGPPG